MFRPLSSLVPNAADLLDLQVEELSGVLLTHLNSYESGSNPTVYQRGMFSRSAFFHNQEAKGFGALRTEPEYGDRQHDVIRALMEAWAWLQGEGFLVMDEASTGNWFIVPRRAQQLKSREDFEAYRKASLLPRGQLHPFIASEVYPAFLQGKYDIAVFQAFREVEVAVRDAGKFGANDYGTDLMRKAFRPAPKSNQPPAPPGPLADTQLPTAEQEAMANLFTGAIGLYKNPQSHRHVPTHPEDAAEVIVFASQLLRIVDRLKP